ncbi:MAG: ferredoxin [Candidatus Kerfeldbacteria bacterium]|nr:ferredoxin [Candidatus Kerfeldbacteria bacterium]
MKVILDRSVCIGAADCAIIAPETFALDDEGKAVLKNPQGNDLATILEAAKSCPVACIYVFDDDGKQIWPESGEPPPSLRPSPKGEEA